MGQKLIQTDAGGGTYVSIHWWFISHYKEAPVLNSISYSQWHSTLKSSKEGK